MSDSEDDVFSHASGFVTPPLSPTKTISTEGWFSPRTPESPCRSRNRFLTRNAEYEADALTPPTSPSKSKSANPFGALTIPELLHAPHGVCLQQTGGDSPEKQHVPLHDDRASIPALPAFNSVHPHSSHDLTRRSNQVSALHSLANFNISVRDVFQLDSPRFSRRSFSDSFLSATDTVQPNSPCTPDTSRVCPLKRDPPSCSSPPSVNEVSLPNKLRQLPFRHSSSPLRPSQWAARGGLLQSPRRRQSCTPDRFIASRRPPAVARESFELNKPTERLERVQTARDSRTSADPFTRRLHRSGRLNDELRGLREAHSMIMSRASANRRNASLAYRRNSWTLGNRQVSAGAVWNVGGPSAISDTVVAVSNGRGSMLGTGTNAPLYTSTFLNRADPEAELEAYECRLALALDIDQTERILQHAPAPAISHSVLHCFPSSHARHVWRDSAWTKDSVSPLLDAPQLRDDYYCTLLAYSHTAKCLAVGLGTFVHLWSERSGVDTPESLNVNAGSTTAGSDVQHVTSLDFSSPQGGQAILAVGRADGRISLWSPFDTEPRFDATQPKPVSCVSWRPTTVQRPSLRDRAMNVATEELLIGDEVGHIYFYSIEWPSENQSALFGWHGAMTLLARMMIHTQQICGLAWAPDGELFASGGNDNSCFLFETKKVLRPNGSSGSTSATLDVREGPNGESIYSVTNRSSPVLHLPHTAARHKWTLNAAVKAMAFCPWQRGLIAIGGGSNDRCIYFYHTRSGTCLATIDCAAQVTSLVWSQTRREIAATFGFTQPEHPYRVAVFAWPSCEQVVAVPWWDENRALCAVAYPGGPTYGPQTDDDGRASDEDGMLSRRSVGEGCIVIAASDMAIRFHEIWSDVRGPARMGLMGAGTAGLLGGSDILEGLHDILRDTAVIR
ncbi:meiosis-specific APC/C activator protein AMA1 [Paraphoma chrysanthemicola]|nr:meiosis-specific APC/C activator protein AMA1 [Paraphoma chrysanthemicola]